MAHLVFDEAIISNPVGESDVLHDRLNAIFGQRYGLSSMLRNLDNAARPIRTGRTEFEDVNQGPLPRSFSKASTRGAKRAIPAFARSPARPCQRALAGTER